MANNHPRGMTDKELIDAGVAAVDRFGTGGTDVLFSKLYSWEQSVMAEVDRRPGMRDAIKEVREQREAERDAFRRSYY